jgi:hypothetical protein
MGARHVLAGHIAYSLVLTAVVLRLLVATAVLCAVCLLLLQ